MDGMLLPMLLELILCTSDRSAMSTSGSGIGSGLDMGVELVLIEPFVVGITVTPENVSEPRKVGEAISSRDIDGLSMLSRGGSMNGVGVDDEAESGWKVIGSSETKGITPLSNRALRLLKKSNESKSKRSRPRKPPTTPPTMAPVFTRVEVAVPINGGVGADDIEALELCVEDAIEVELEVESLLVLFQ